ncbi:MAG: peptidoglycan-binding protein, partial [Schwartzia sp. (in: firmicutes)]
MGRGKVWLLAAAFALSFGGVVAAAPLLKLGAEGHDVRIVQAALQKAGYALDGVTGVFDEATRAAVLAFQRDQRLAESGEVDRATWHALRGAPPAKQAAPAPPQTAPAPAPSWETSSPKAKPPEKEASEKKPSAQADAGTAAPAEPKPAEPKPAEPKPAEPKPA